MLRRLGGALLICLLVWPQGGECGEANPAAAAQAEATERLLGRAKGGEAISQARAGWFVVDLLSDMAAGDEDLSAFVHRDGRFIESYLINVFQYHAEDEVAALATLAAQPDTPHRASRQAARWGLEALRHLPDDDDPPAAQEADRQALIAALTNLDRVLRGMEVKPTP